jgi:hypothetical protein
VVNTCIHNRNSEYRMKQLLLFFFLILFGTVSPNKIQEEKTWPADLNTTRDANYLSELEKNVILELNKVRSNPQQYMEEYMEELLTSFEGKIFSYPGQEPVITQEGVSPLKECIRELRKMASLPLLIPAEGLAKASDDLVGDQQKNGGIGHIARNGSTPQKRIEKYGNWDICSAEDITYGSFEARQIVIFLLIDDGVPNRAHRKNILNPCFRVAGVSFGTHPNYKSICVIDYAGEYKTK